MKLPGRIGSLVNMKPENRDLAWMLGVLAMMLGVFGIWSSLVELRHGSEKERMLREMEERSRNHPPPRFLER